MTSNNKTSSPHFEYEFGGPIGAFSTTLLLPIVTIWLAHCASVGQLDLSPKVTFTTTTADSSSSSSLQQQQQQQACSTEDEGQHCLNIDVQAFIIAAIGCVLWFIYLVVLERILPCDIIAGAPLPMMMIQETTQTEDIINNNTNNTNKKAKVDAAEQKRLNYRINGHLSLWLTLALLSIGKPNMNLDDFFALSGGGVKMTFQPYYSLHLLCEYYVELALATVVLTCLLSIWLYIKSFQRPNDTLLAKGGCSGYAVYDFYMGRELNPRSFSNSFDWKEFCELRPGLILWLIINLAMAIQQHRLLGYVTGSMILINVFQGFYVWDALYNERAILTTMDITTDGFGFMLCFGDMAWVPITYSLQARYLVHYDPHLNLIQLSGILLLNCFGYFIFRSANGEKDAFRTDPNGLAVQHLEYMQTQRGTRLLTSGWWGMARKINYTGDWIMGLSWCLVCGVQSVVPYFYAVYFCVLLVHRAARDDHLCGQKYGEDWAEYKKKVPYLFVPGVV